MAFIESLRSLNAILSTDLLIESRYDIMYNLSALNTYATTAKAGQIQIASIDEIEPADGFGAITPIYLSGSSLEFPLKYNTSIVTTTLLGANTNALASVQYVDLQIDNLSATLDIEVGALDNRYLRSDQSTTPIANGYDLGSTLLKWDNVYATNFNGTATAALYSDLAEKYTCAEKVEIGDVISIYTGDEDYEVQKSQGIDDIRIIGVVSEAPGFVMSSETDGPVVGLIGKVPVKVIGKCKRGDILVPSAIQGVARVFNPNNNEVQHVIGFASANKDTTEIGLVNSIIK